MRVAVSPGATVFWRLERKASALTSHHPPVGARSDLQPDRAHLVQIANAACVVALAGAPKRGDGDGQGGWGCPTEAIAVVVPATVGDTAASARGVEVSVLTTPDAAGPAGRDVEGVGLVGVELKSASGDDGLACTWLNAWPYWVRAFVVQCNCRC
uniref:Uncharacterized protein n=1 Tax=Nelumbo nucifera TaxID=4432 RepID=A0A822YVH3_NELNU|nr:TPA_asm: hypothetical protein HUJ06_007198 [Nelumbo nucifera]